MFYRQLCKILTEVNDDLRKMIEDEVAVKAALLTNNVESINTIVQDRLEAIANEDIDSFDEKREAEKVAIKKQVDAETDRILRQIDALKRHVDKQVKLKVTQGEMTKAQRNIRVEYYAIDLATFPYETRDCEIITTI